MIRKDVARIAEKLSEKSGLNVDHIYAFLMWTGRDIGKNPKLEEFEAVPGLVYRKGDRDKYYIEKYVPPVHNQDQGSVGRSGPDYEDLILAKQERWQDD